MHMRYAQKSPLLFAPGIFFMLFCRLLIFFQNQLFLKILSGILTESQTVWIQIRLHILSGLVLVQTVCKGYQQTTLVGNELKVYTDIASWARGLNSGLSCHLYSTLKMGAGMALDHFCWLA